MKQNPPSISFLRIPVLRGKVKVKCSLVQALRLCTGCTTHKGSRGIAVLFLDHGTRRSEGSASYPGGSLPLTKTRYPLYRRMGGPKGRSGRVQKISPPPRFDLQTVQPVASHYSDYNAWLTVLRGTLCITLIAECLPLGTCHRA